MRATIPPNKLLLASGPIGAMIFVTTFLIEGYLRHDYDPWRHPVSSLSLEPDGWIQVCNFIITGFFIMMFSVGIKKFFPQEKRLRGISIYLMSVGIGLAGAGVFRTDPVYGYPTTLPLRLAQFSWHGHLHYAFSILVFICIPAGCVVSWKYFVVSGQKGMSVFCLLSGMLVFFTFILAGLGFKQVPSFVNFAGLLQRSSIIFGSLWLAVLGIYMIQQMKKQSIKTQLL